MIIITLLLILIAGLANGLMDRISFHYHTIPKSWNENYWNPQKSWKNKWKNGDAKQGEKFWLSSTFLVALTDGWHILKSVMLMMITLAITINIEYQLTKYWLLNYTLIYTIVRSFFGAGFKILYR